MFYTTSDMPRGIVSQKPFSRKKRKQPLRKRLNRSGVSIPEIKISKKLKYILTRWMWFTLLIIIGIAILVKSLFFKPEQKISQVRFSEGTEATYRDPYLFDYIANEAKWKNYFLFIANKDELLSKIQNGFTIKNFSWENIKFKFPFVWNIDFQLEEKAEIEISEPEIITIWIKFPSNINWTWDWTWFSTIQREFPLRQWILSDEWSILWVELSYYEPKVLVKINDKEFAVFDENTYVELKEWMLLWIRSPDEEPLFTIETPSYLTWTENLDWFFFEMNLDKIMNIISLAKEKFWSDMTRFVYLAWSTRFAIFTSDDKTLYFNFPEWWNIKEQRDSQIFKYDTLKEKYTKFDKIEKINLWALEENKTIIMNY